MGRWDDWNAIESAMAQAEVDRILRLARVDPETLEAEQLAQPATPEEPRLTTKGTTSGAGLPPVEYSEPQWYGPGQFGRYVRTPKRLGDGFFFDGEWEALPTPKVDPRRGEYLAAKAMRAAGERGLRHLRQIMGRLEGRDE